MLCSYVDNDISHCDSFPLRCVHTSPSVSLLLLTVRRHPLEFPGRGAQPDGAPAHRGARPPLQLAEGDERRRHATPSTLVGSLFARANRPPASHQVNQSLSKIYVHVQAYRLYVGWLKEGQQNASLPSDVAHNVNTHLRHLSHLLTSSLQQVRRQITNQVSIWRLNVPSLIPKT